MNTGRHEHMTPERNGIDTSSEDVKPQQEEEGREVNAQCAEGSLKTEAEEVQDSEQDGDRETVPEENTEEPTEEGLERGLDEDEEEDEEGDALNEAQDLSLMDYSRYDSDDLSNTLTAVAAGGGGRYTSEATPPHIQESGKLNCDICGLSCISINVLLVHKRSHTGERPFHCSQCGASFTQKGNLLRHIKLHSGEKPFKCPMCSYACRRRDALSGHLRTHSVEKPFQCNQCSRSYKQRSSLEEHRERCHVFTQSRRSTDRAEEGQPSRTPMGSERALLLDRLASNVAKRKSSMPQKFTGGAMGDNGVCLDLSFTRETIPQADSKDPLPGPPGPTGHQPIITGPDSDQGPSFRPYPFHRDPNPMGLANDHKIGLPLLGLPHAAQPPLSMDPFPADSSHMSQSVPYSSGPLQGGLSHQNGAPHPHTQPTSLLPPEASRAGRVFPCGYCRVIFLDYVMFTIHMGCHGFRDPLECNVCGHRSRDRYEFSSHIARGEHCLEVR